MMNDENNRPHKGSISFIIFIKCHIRGSMVRQCCIFEELKLRIDMCIIVL
jgi:hypothetical protein